MQIKKDHEAPAPADILESFASPVLNDFLLVFDVRRELTYLSLKEAPLLYLTGALVPASKLVVGLAVLLCTRYPWAAARNALEPSNRAHRS